MDLRHIGLSVLSKTQAVDMKTAQKNNLYTCPTGKIAYVAGVLICSPSASMAGGTDYDFGTGANADTWRQTVDLSDLTTATTDFTFILGVDETGYERMVAADVFGVKVITGTTAACTATIYVIGMECDSSDT